MLRNTLRTQGRDPCVIPGDCKQGSGVPFELSYDAQDVVYARDPEKTQDSPAYANILGRGISPHISLRPHTEHTDRRGSRE